MMKIKLFTTLLIMLTCKLFAQIPTNDLVASYEFNGNLNSSVPSTLSLNNNSNGTVSYGLDRFGSTTRLNVNRQQLSGYNFTGTNNTVSISFWVGLTGINSEQRVLQFFDPNGNGLRVDYDPGRSSIHGGVLGVVVNGNGKTEPLGSSTNPWRHIVVTMDRVAGRFVIKTYIDGVENTSLSNSFASPNALTQGNAPFIISPLASFTGVIDDIYIYNRALSSQEVLALYNFVPVAKKIFVDINASGTNNGTSWADAYTSLEDALLVFRESDEIWVAQGKYTANSNFLPFLNINKPDVKIYGGFNGTETALTQRDFITNETILSGDIAQPDAPQISFSDYINTPSRTDNSQFIISTSAAGENLLLDGLTISDAHNIGSNLGAAIIKHPAVEKLTIKNCIIKNNVCRGVGSGIFADFEAPTGATNYKGELIIENCRFTNNWGAFATSLYAFNRNSDLDINVSNSLFDNNYAGNGSNIIGGIASSAMWLRNLDTNTQTANATTLTANVTNCTFAYNIDNGSGIAASDRSVVSVSRQESANTARLNLRNSIFYGNSDGGVSMIPRITKPISSSIGGVVPSQDIDLDNNLAEQSWGILPTTSTNNISGNPLFTDATNGDFTLQTGSLAIDAGDNTYSVGTTDLANNARVFNTTVDMGAFEFVSSTTLSIKDFNTNNLSFTMYPNPIQNNLHIELEGGLKLVEIYSVLGTKVLSSNQATLNVATLTEGVYFLKVQTQKGAIATKRFIKK